MRVTGQPHWLVQDNAPCHAAKATLAQFQEWGIKYMDHLPASPDLNLAESPIGQIKYNLKNRRHRRPTNLAELRAALPWEWDTYPQAKLAPSCDSIPEQIACGESHKRGPDSILDSPRTPRCCTLIVSSGCKLEPSKSHALGALDVEVDKKLSFQSSCWL